VVAGIFEKRERKGGREGEKGEEGKKKRGRGRV
jgi:hypothetical protein